MRFRKSFALGAAVAGILAAAIAYAQVGAQVLTTLANTYYVTIEGAGPVGTVVSLSNLKSFVNGSGAGGAAGAGAFTTITGTSTSANAVASGPAGATNPTLQVDASTASAATGVKIKSAAAAGGVAVSAISSGTDESLTIDAKGAGTVTINGTGTGLVAIPRHVTTGSTAPGLSSCGGGSPAITGSDTAGIVTMGTSATGCIITFATAYTGTPYCVVSWIATPLASQSYTTSNSAITLTQTSTSGNKVQYICLGPSGG